MRLTWRGHARVRPGGLHPLQRPEWKRPSDARQDAFMAVLERARIPATIRREKGHDIAAACGQLRRQQTAITA